MSDIRIEERAPWWTYQRTGYLQAWCGEAHVTINLEPLPGHEVDVQIGDQGEEDTYLPTMYTRAELADWAKLLQWVADQPWPEWTAP